MSQAEILPWMFALMLWKNTCMLPYVLLIIINTVPLDNMHFYSRRQSTLHVGQCAFHRFEINHRGAVTIYIQKFLLAMFFVEMVEMYKSKKKASQNSSPLLSSHSVDKETLGPVPFHVSCCKKII